MRYFFVSELFWGFLSVKDILILFTPVPDDFPLLVLLKKLNSIRT